MKQKLKVSVSKTPQPGSTVSCKTVTLRERILRRLLGQKKSIMVLVPSEQVEELMICESKEGGKDDGQNEA